MDDNYLLSFYYLISWNGYPQEENTREPALTMLYFCKFINIFYYDYLKRPIITSLLIDSAPWMARPTIKPKAEALSKQSYNRPIKNSNTSKHTKKIWTFVFYLIYMFYLNNKKKIPIVIWSYLALLCLIVSFFDSSIFTQFLVFTPRY